MPETLDCVVIGAGVIGLAIARELAATGREVVVLEAESAVGTHSSSRNSEVIHAGIYYPEDSLKAQLCVRGKHLLYEYCAARRLPHRRIGKLIVATDRSQLGQLEKLRKQAERNGVDDLEFVDRDAAHQLEPQVACAGGLLSPSTGIIDSHAYMLALQADIEAAGGTVVLATPVANVERSAGGFALDAGGETVECGILVNAAGLGAAQVVPAGIPAPAIRYAKGHYFSYPGQALFQRLVYPLPADGGLGIHATLDLSGAVRFGPDVTWVDSIDYAFDQTRKSAFVGAIRPYFPALDETRLTSGYTGIRPKLHGPGAPPADFVIETERDHGVAGLVNLYGIESPGLTASLAIGEFVRRSLLAE